MWNRRNQHRRQDVVILFVHQHKALDTANDQSAGAECHVGHDHGVIIGQAVRDQFVRQDAFFGQVGIKPGQQKAQHPGDIGDEAKHKQWEAVTPDRPGIVPPPGRE